MSGRAGERAGERASKWVCDLRGSESLYGYLALSPDAKMHILLTVLHAFLMELVRRICLNIKTSCPWSSHSLFSSLDCLNK